MNYPCLYLDDHAMDGDVVRGLRSRGIDVVTAADAGYLPETGRQFDDLQPEAQYNRSTNLRDTRWTDLRPWTTGGSYAAICNAKVSR